MGYCLRRNSVYCGTAGGGVVCFADSIDYLSKGIIRPPLYPLIIELFRILFGRNYLHVVVVFQCIAVLWSAYYLSSIIRKYYKLPLLASIIIHFFLISPLLHPHRIYGGMVGPIANWIMTEALSYCIMLIIVGQLIHCFHGPSMKRLFSICLLSVAVTLIREQFAFIYPVAAVFFVYLGYKHVLGWRKVSALVISLMVLVVIANIGELFYHHVYNQHWGKATTIKSCVLGSVLFFCDTSDVKDMPNSPERAVLETVLSKMDSLKLLSKYQNDFGSNISYYYSRNFGAIIYKVLIPCYADYYHYVPNYLQPIPQQLPDSRADDELTWEVESFSLKVFPHFFKKHYREFARLTMVKFLDSFRFREGLFCAFLLLSLLLTSRIEKSIAELFMVVAAMAIANRLIITSITSAGDRYLFYTGILEQVLIAVFIGRLYLTRQDQMQIPDPKVTSAA